MEFLLGALVVMMAFCLGMLFEFFLHIKEIVDYVKQVNKANSSLRQFKKKMRQLEMEYMAYANEIIRLRTQPSVKITAADSESGTH